MKKILIVAMISALCAGFGTGCVQENPKHASAHQGEGSVHDHEAEGHDHDEAAEEHSDHDEQGETGQSETHGEHEGHRHEDELLVSLTDTGMQLAGIATDSVVMHTVRQTVLLPGEVAFDEEHTAHVAPRFAGIIRDVSGATGDSVSVGDQLAQIENNEHLSVFTVKAPLNGRIIGKHAVRGEYTAPENSLFVISDLSKIWVLCQVNPRFDVRTLNGRRATVIVPGTEQKADGSISYVAPFADPQTRTVTARIVLANRRGEWRPGMFVDVAITTESPEAVTAVRSGAVQVMNTSHVVFVPVKETVFRPVTVTVGRSDETFTEITGGIGPGAVYVAKGAFELKAHLVTKTLGEHAGHGH